MNDIVRPDGAADVPWPTSNERMRVPDTSMLPGSELTPPAAVGALKSAVRGAHEGLDRFAERAEPAVRQMSDSVAAAEEAVRAKAVQLRQTGDAWTESLRCTVRDNPLVAVAAAVALGAVLSRLMRPTR